MAGDDSAAEDRTEAATAKRLEQAREQGQLPVSRDVTMLASLVGASFGCVALLPGLIRRIADQAADVLALLHRVHLDSGTIGAPVVAVLLSAGLIIGAVALPAALCSIGAVLLQTQFFVGGSPITFKPSRISPGAGFGRIVSQQNLLDFLKSCGRLAVLCLLAWSVLDRSPVEAMAVIGADLGWLVPAARDQVQSLARPLLIMLACFAAVDVLLVRFQHSKSLRMTRDQVRLEARDAEGDPFIKGKLRRIRQQRSRRRMMAAVRTADVVITNPTHYAVALAYEQQGGGAPRVVAKGADFMAARIREEAQAHGVAVVPSPPLARALFAVELDQEIPAEHFRAVAEVIAFVWKLNARMGSLRGGLDRHARMGENA